MVSTCCILTTGSTSIQNNFHKWTSSDEYLLKQWSWPVPQIVSKYESKDENNWNWNPSKGFYAFAELLRNTSSHNITDRDLFQHVPKEDILKSYQMEFLRAWIMGYNLIIGSEAFDNVIKDDDGDEIIDRLVQYMPFNYTSFDNDVAIKRQNNDGRDLINKKMTVVVTYRVPRIKHLISIWRETRKKNQSFQQWIVKTKNTLGAIDSLGLVEKFLNKGLNVVIADISGITNSGYDISNVIACEILQVPCTDQNQVKGSSPPLVMNTKHNFKGTIDLSDEQLDLMDQVMKDFDCKYKTMLKTSNNKDERLKLLYPTELMDIMDSCDDKKHPPTDRLGMKKHLVCIAKGNNNCIV